MDVGRRLKATREHQGVSLRELADRLRKDHYPITYSALSQLERGERKKLNRDLAEHAAIHLSWPSLDALMATTDPEPPRSGVSQSARLPTESDIKAVRELLEQQGQLLAAQQQAIARLSTDVDALKSRERPSLRPIVPVVPPAAYPPVIVFEVAPGTAGPAGGFQEPVSEPAIPDRVRQRFGAFRVTGECMTPELQLGQWVIVDKDAAPVVGRTVVALVAGQERPLIKRYHPHNGVVELRPLNGDPVRVRRDRLEFLAPVIGHYQPD